MLFLIEAFTALERRARMPVRLAGAMQGEDDHGRDHLRPTSVIER